jgi:uncharacterized protein
MKDYNFLLNHVEGIFNGHNLNRYPYHNWKHTLRVMKKVELIAEAENVSEEDINLIKIAALYHDIGFIYGPLNHEESSVMYAVNDLTEFGYSEEQLEIISGIILATTIPQNPKTPLENILADADLEYLGTDEYDRISGYLFQELLNFNPALSEDRWIDLQIDFMKHHRYHTNYCLKNRVEKKEENLQRIIKSRS